MLEAITPILETSLGVLLAVTLVSWLTAFFSYRNREYDIEEASLFVAIASTTSLILLGIVFVATIDDRIVGLVFGAFLAVMAIATTTLCIVIILSWIRYILAAIRARSLRPEILSTLTLSYIADVSRLSAGPHIPNILALVAVGWLMFLYLIGAFDLLLTLFKYTLSE